MSLPSMEHLVEHCLFCDPAAHGQESQIMLRGDRLYLFAGLGAIVPGYTIITPYTCKDGSTSMSQLTEEMLEEYVELRSLVGEYFEDRYGVLGLAFEHGRAGACLVDGNDTRHCYHAHACLYPTSASIVDLVTVRQRRKLRSVFELATAVGSSPYLYVEEAMQDASLAFLVGDGGTLESQHLRRCLATAVSAPDLWDWRMHPTVDAATHLSADFRRWLSRRSRRREPQAMPALSPATTRQLLGRLLPVPRPRLAIETAVDADLATTMNRLGLEVTRVNAAAASVDGVWLGRSVEQVRATELAATLARARAACTPDGEVHLAFHEAPSVRRQAAAPPVFARGPAAYDRALAAADLHALAAWTEETAEGRVRHVVARSPTAMVPEGRVLGRLGEDGVHDLVFAHLAGDRSEPHLGDDAVVLSWSGGDLVMSVDAGPASVARLIGRGTYEEDGWLAGVIGLSDVASMGADPVGMLLAVEAPESLPQSDFEDFLRGLQRCSAAYRCPVVGGNTKDGPRFSAVTTILGSLPPGAKGLRRDAARPDQVVMVIGGRGVFWASVITVLAPATAMALDRVAVDRFDAALRTPAPRLVEGRLLRTLGVECAMDSSDGPTACFRSIARASNVDIVLDDAALTPTDDVTSVARAAEIDPRKLGLAWGDWQLVCVVPTTHVDRILAAVDPAVGAAVVGWTVAGQGLVWVEDSFGERTRLVDNSSQRFSGSSYYDVGVTAYLDRLHTEPLTVAPADPVAMP